MGISQAVMRISPLALAAALLCVVVAHGNTEVESLDTLRQGEDASVPAAKVALMRSEGGFNPDELLEIAQAPDTQASAGVVELTKQIKGIQGDIASVQNTADTETAASNQAGENAAASAPGAGKDAHMKDHIDSGAAAEDAKATLDDKKKQLVELTIQQHEEAKKAAVDAHGAEAASTSYSSSSGDDSDYDSSSSSSGGYGASGTSSGGYGESSGGEVDTSNLFENWLSDFDSKHSGLVRTVEQAFSFSSRIMDGLKTKKDEVHAHMEKVKKAYDKESKERMAAQERAKEFKEKMQAAKAAEKKSKAAEKATKDKMQEELQKADERKGKAVEKKVKAVETEERLKKKFEKEVKKLKGREIPDCGPIKEKEKKAKEQIQKLQEENQKIRDDCEKKSKEMSTKAKERLTKAKEKTAKETERANKLAQDLEAAKEKISELTQELEAAKSKIEKLEATVETQKQEIEHHKSEENKEKERHKNTREKLAKAEEKIETLEEKLAQMVAKYNKIKSTLGHINTVSGEPHRTQ